MRSYRSCCCGPNAISFPLLERLRAGKPSKKKKNPSLKTRRAGIETLIDVSASFETLVSRSDSSLLLLDSRMQVVRSVGYFKAVSCLRVLLVERKTSISIMGSGPLASLVCGERRMNLKGNLNGTSSPVFSNL